MKILPVILLTSSLMLSHTLQAEETGTDTSFMQKLESMGTADDAGYSGENNEIPLNYTSNAVHYQACIDTFGNNSITLEQATKKLKETIATFNKFNKEHKQDQDKDKQKEFISELENQYACAALVATMQGAEVLDDEEYAEKKHKESMDQKIKCSTTGITTLDYPACAKAITAYNGFMLATQALVEYQKVTLAAYQIDLKSQIKPEDPLGSLKAQKGIILKQREQLQTLTAVQAAKGAALFAMVRQIPTAASLLQQCRQKDPIQWLKDFDDNSIKLIPSDSVLRRNSDNICHFVIAKNNMIHNEARIDQFKYAIAQAGMEVAKNLVVAKLLKDRAGQIDELMAKYQQHNPSTSVAFLPAELAKFCEEHPEDSRCSGGLPQGTSQFGSSGLNVDFGNNGAATTFEQNGDEFGTDGHDSTMTKAATAGADIAPTFGHTVNKGGGLSRSGLNSATLKPGQVASGGGGGGGGAPGGVSAPSGGDIRTGGKNYQDYSKVKMKKMTYGGGRSGALYARGGTHMRSKKKSTVGNPFSKLFGKKKNQSRFNFRSLASKQIPQNGKSLFERITRRYTAVNKQNRLIIYDEVP